MRNVSALLLILIIGSFAWPIGTAGKAAPFDVKPLVDTLDAVPGETLSIPVNVTNNLNEGISGLTVSLILRTKEKAITVSRTISLNPLESTIVDLTLKVPLLPPGTYSAEVVGEFGNLSVERNVSIRIEKFVYYTISSDVGGFYTAGSDIIAHLYVTSRSNVPISGDVRVVIVRGKNSSAVASWNFNVTIDPGKRWSEEIRIPSLNAGNYTFIAIGDLSNVSQKFRKDFRVLPRRYHYSAEFKNGAIVVKVLTESGSPAEGVEVWINGTVLHTDESGEAIFIPQRQGTYLVKINLDGVIVTKLVEVRCPYTYRVWYSDGRIWVRVSSENGTPVQGIEVEVLNQSLLTNESGLASIEVSQSGKYDVTLYLGECIERTSVSVGKLLVVPELNDNVLIITVLDSNGRPLPNVNITLRTPSNGTLHFKTNDDGKAFVPLDKLGGSRRLILIAKAEGYVTYSKAIDLETTGKTAHTSQTSTTTASNEITEEKPRGLNPKTILLALLLILGTGATSYLALAVPHVVEEELDRYYFVKLRAPRLRPLRNFRWEKHMNAVEVRATKGNARMEGNKIVWEIEELDPKEEAVLQVVLG